MIDLVKDLSVFNLSKNNTGSVVLQIIRLSERIGVLSLHLKKFNKDFHSKKGLIAMVNKRKKFLKYVKDKNINTYLLLINKLKLRK